MELADELFGRGPIDAAVGDAHAVAEIFLRHGEGLAAAAEVALDHGAHNRSAASGDLGEEGAEDVGLELRFFRGVVVRAVDEDRLGQIGLGEERFGLRDVRRRIVRPSGTAAQDDMAVGVAASDDGGGGTTEVDAEEGLGLRGGFDGVDGGGEGAVGAVLEAERHREAAGHLAVGL